MLLAKKMHLLVVSVTAKEFLVELIPKLPW